MQAAPLAGMAAKLEAIIHRGQWRSDCPGFPWPGLGAVLKDIRAMGNIDQDPRIKVAGCRPAARA
jgi:hypothetical protein